MPTANSAERIVANIIIAATYIACALGHSPKPVGKRTGDAAARKACCVGLGTNSRGHLVASVNPRTLEYTSIKARMLLPRSFALVMTCDGTLTAVPCVFPFR